jgi:hypothetical protein
VWGDKLGELEPRVAAARASALYDEISGLELGALAERASEWRLAPGILLIIVGVSLWGYISQYHSTYAPNQAVVIDDNTPIYRLPAESGEDKAKLTLKAGEYVNIVEHRADWSRIRIDNAEGWLKNAAIASIW